MAQRTDESPGRSTTDRQSHDIAVAHDADALRKWSQEFHRFGIARVTNLLVRELRSAVLLEAEGLLASFAERRDLRLATTGNTRRSMSVVPSETIAQNSDLIRAIYANTDLLHALGCIAGERLHACPLKDEEFLISRHEKAGDTHGWHWGDFSFALIWVLLAPELDDGGLLQCVPHTKWDKSSPRILRYLCDNPINTYYFASGDIYFLRTDTTLHRTIPLQRDVTRIMLNMTWASGTDLERTLTEDDRWWENADVSAATKA
ncbi:MAG: HalD/BesD family halogenase [Acidimicrobiales bacterium]